MSKVSINGRLIASNRAAISVFDRGYLYGEGVFESLRVYRGVPLFAELHLARLRDNCQRIGIPFTMSVRAWRTMLHRVIRANRAVNAAVRVTVSVAGSAAVMQSAQQLKTNVVAFIRPPIKRPPTLYRRGASVILIRSVVADPPAISTIKSTNYLSKLLARREVAAARADEGLLCTAPRGEKWEKGDRHLFPTLRIVEGTFTNLFAVRGGILTTPPVHSGLLPGITRKLVLLLASQLRIPCREAPITMHDLQRADELFLTGSTSAVLPIREVRSVTRKTAPGPVTQRLATAYQRLIASHPF